ncbi:TetR/AcrR family transcriptional regulator [Amycolatopsis tucumanensis]|uniref:TetR/AcrR family transcriptional regulator n=1 Tax=Amycolatopsis tucumanensis TaxID=401106 RepID=A0ABP7JIR0_9PSEU|nr:TetR/AcrR family transcriptional regulator [Amycolatopsis tucumanensis]MCF6425170.1 TetR/AcrR family transcriptional regulator [Amycolatopsis tucumanensis]
MGEGTTSRRERLRAETAREIKTIALELMAKGGPDAISLRAIAREMGMTAGAIYGYYPTRDDLITTLISDVYTSLVDTVEAARDAVPADDPAGRILAWGRALRSWSLANPEGFRLIYGDPVPGYRAPEGGAAADAERRACALLTELIAGAWPAVQAPDEFTWEDFGPSLVQHMREEFPGLPPAVLALSLRTWGRMHGLISLEVYGHLGPQVTDPAKLYESELRALLRSLGL